MNVQDRRIRKKTDDPFHFEFEGISIQAWPGETIAAALIASGYYHLRSAEDNSARGLLCAIGVCWECRCLIDGRCNQRACLTEVRPGMVVRRQCGPSMESAAGNSKQ